jgi:hypothetical protein
MKKMFVLAIVIIGCGALLKGQSSGSFPGPAPSRNPTQTPRFSSGIRGVASLFPSGGPGLGISDPTTGYPLVTWVSVYDEAGKWVTITLSNPVGQFYCYLKPGNYILQASLPGQRFPPRNLDQYIFPPAGVPFAAPVPITVATNRFAPVEIRYSYGNL